MVEKENSEGNANFKSIMEFNPCMHITNLFSQQYHPIFNQYILPLSNKPPAVNSEKSLR